MNSNDSWRTTEQLMKDMSMLMGRPVRKIDKSYVLEGNAPPPVMSEAEDEEMLAQFGDSIGRGFQCENAPPDLHGIREMIRLVQNGDCDDNREVTGPSNGAITISKVSKLNPHVREFVPKSASTSSRGSDVSVNGDKKTDDNKTDCNSNVVDANVNELANKLKDKISIASKSDSFEDQKQKNVAIASLLRLYATNNTQKATQPVKLMTPDFYEQNNKSDETQTSTKELEKVQSPSTTQQRVRNIALPSEHKSDPSIGHSPSPSCSSTEVKSEPALSSQKSKASPKPILDPVVKKSIEKVNNWLGEPVPKKAPTIFLGPIEFKRKEPPVAKSPVVEPEPKEVNSNVQYKPSEYAADLGKKFMERSKARESQNTNMWTDLDVILKKRDEVIKKKRLEQVNGSNGDAPQG
ncbi:uncharacterized protein LOC142975139 [Anticarsia gemmatalis]|uniref:uncharacterized protein LOC142975139 n=1 Tax=Anticarsia gemmatalis TaxID=129554 RepID=UPI003F7574F5